MSSPSSSLSSALSALGDSIAGLGSGLKSIADKATSAQSTAQSAQETAEAAIPQSQAGTEPGDVIVLDSSGRLPAVDGSQLTGVRASAAPVINLTSGDSVELDLTPLLDGAPGIDFVLPLAANTTTSLAFVNVPSTGVEAAFAVFAIGASGAAIVWPANVRWPGGATPALTDVNGQIDTFVFVTFDGGTTYLGYQAGGNQ